MSSWWTVSPCWLSAVWLCHHDMSMAKSSVWPCHHDYVICIDMSFLWWTVIITLYWVVRGFSYTICGFCAQAWNLMVSGGGGCSGNFYDHAGVKVNMYLRSVTITHCMEYVTEHHLFFRGSVHVVFWSDWPITNPLASDLMERPCEAGMAGAFAVNVKGGQSWSMHF